MSVDLSNAEVQRLQHAVLEKGEPTTWFLLQYDPTNASALIPLASGPDPPLPQIKENLAACGEDLVYGYADVQGKGLVVVYMVEGVGGVRRARAVVHSRALASLFPDYSALITINKASDLTDDLVADKLGLEASTISGPASQSRDGATGQIPTMVNLAAEGHAPQTADQSTTADTGSRSLSPPVPDTSTSSPSKYPTTQDPSRQPSLRSDMALVSAGAADPQPRGSIDSRARSSPSGPTQDSSTDQLQTSRFPDPPADASHPTDTQSPITEPEILTPSSAPAVDSHSPPPTVLGPPVDLASTSGRPSGDIARSQRSTPPPQPPIKSDEEAVDPTVPAPSQPHNQSSAPVSALQRDLDLAAGNTGTDPSDPATPTAPTARAEKDLTTVTPSGQPAPLPLADRMKVQTVSPLSDLLPSPTQATVIHPDKPLDVKGIGSADFFPEHRNRKASLTSRLGSLGQAFGRGGSPRSSSGSAPTQEQGISNSPGGQSPSSTTSPPQKGSGSPTMSRFINSNLIKNFGRRISGTGIPSPTAGERDATGQQDETDTPPPLPPKDTPSPLQTGGPSSARNAPTALSSNFIGNQSISTGNGRPESAGQGSGRGGGISPSPSAKLALAAASQKSVRSEMEIQERFRRDLELKTQEREKERLAEGNGPTGSILADGEEDEGLPYDRPDPDEPVTGELAAKEITPHQGLPNSELKNDEGFEKDLAAADLAETGAAGPGSSVVAQSMAVPESEDRARAQGVPEDVSPGLDDHPPTALAGLATTTNDQTIDSNRGVEDDAELKRQEEAALLAQQVEEHRVKEEQEQAERIRLEEDRAKQEEEERIRLEEEARQLQAQKEAEEKRLRAEKEAEEQRLRAEQEAEEKRLREEREAREIQRKAELRAEMMSGKREGGSMLNGWITVQTTKSLTWRRRHFTLLSHELQLFKAEGDTKPIQTIRLGDSAKVSHTYEESQVQGSFKITSTDGEDYFLYTDSPEDRETVLEGLALALGE